MNVRDKSILVTGAASGLGAACAARLAAAGAQVVAFDLRGPAPDATAGITYVAGDVTDDDAVRGALRLATQKGELAGVVTCAGILRAKRVVSRHGVHPLEDFAEVIRVNLIGTFNVVRLAVECLQANSPNDQGERGVVVTTASVAAFEGQIGQAAYSASKGGVAAMTLPLARELGSQGIRVMSIAPGVFETPMMGATPDSVRAALTEQIPFPPRLGRPAEFADLVLHIFENTMLNGSVVRLDGGLRMAAR